MNQNEPYTILSSGHNGGLSFANFSWAIESLNGLSPPITGIQCLTRSQWGALK